ncbi:MAG TPA: ribbon-helix-helix protein, CopG family [Acidimicrobiales bacterium]|nr:ribbon-helix-helix protein, CopG family [Acidimicrobiales bacterium]
MKRTTVMLEDEVDARLRREARRRGTSVSELVRAAIDDAYGTPGRRPRRLAFIGIGDSGLGDAGERFDDYLLEDLEADRRNQGRADDVAS